MKKLILFIFSALLSITCYSQSATYRSLLTLNHNEDNNGFNLKAKPVAEDFSSKKSMIWSNAYFHYFKGTNIDNPQTALRFSVINEQIYQIYFEETEPITITYTKEDTDKVLEVSATMFELDNGKIITTKLKSKSLMITKEPKLIKVSIDKENIKKGAYLKVTFETEKFDVKKLGPYNFTKPTSGDYELIMSTNIPRPFSYKKPEYLLLKDEKVNKFKLLQFTNSTPPIIDYIVDSDSYKWILKDQNIKDITFELESVFFGVNVGPSPKFLMEGK